MTLRYIKGNPYFYEVSRVNGKVVSRYVCGGETALVIDQVEQLLAARRWAERYRAREAERKRLAVLDRLEAKVERYFRRVEAVFEAEMTARNFHRLGRHRRWRKARMGSALAKNPKPAEPIAEPATLEEAKAIFRAVSKGDKSKIPQLH